MDGDPSKISYKEHGFNQKVIDIIWIMNLKILFNTLENA